MLIFALYHTHLPPLWWLEFSCTRSSNCMACRLPLCLIATPHSPTNFGIFFQAARHATPTKYRISSPNRRQIEAVNKCLETHLRCFTLEKQHKWLQWLPFTERWYNTHYHEATKVTPYEAMYGQLPPSPISYIPVCSKVQTIDQLL